MFSVGRPPSDMATPPPVEATPPKQSFAKNVLWNWAGIIVNIASAVLITPFVVRKLGDEGYGVWALAFSLVEYFWLLDFGFRSATAKYVAHHRAMAEHDGINEVLSTGLTYFLGIAALVAVATVIIAPLAPGWFAMAEQYRRDFMWLGMMVGFSWSVGAAFMVFQASLEGFQRFDLAGRIYLLVTGVRAAAMVAVLAMGGGLIALGIAVTACQLIGYVANYAVFRRLFPQLSLKRALVTRRMLRKMAGYGVHTVTATTATQLLNQSAPLLLARFQSAAAVGYFNIPVRLMQMTGADIAAKVGVVSTSKSAELIAHGERGSIVRLAEITNRYCLALFLAPSVFLLTYGDALLGRWLGPGWASSSAPLLLPFIIGTGLGVAAQFNSSSILYGLARHAPFARGMLIEGVANLAILLWAIPRYGLLGAAWTQAILMCLNRGVFLPWVICQSLSASFPRFMASVLLRPLLALAPALLLGLFLRHSIPGSSWLQLAIAAAIVVGIYGLFALLLCPADDHRQKALEVLRARLR